MTSSLLARGLVGALALLLLAAPAALADDPTTTSETTTDTTTTTQAAPDPWRETAWTRELRVRTIRYRALARYWRRLMGKPRPVVRVPAREFESLRARRR